MSSSSAAAGQWLDVRSCRTAHVSAADQPSEPDASTCHPVLTGSLATRHNIPVIYPVWARGRCRISPSRFLAECCKRQLNQVSLVLLYFRLSAFSDLYWVCLSVFSCTVLFVSISQVIGCEDRLRNDLYCVGWGVKLYSNQTKPGQKCTIHRTSSVYHHHVLLLGNNDDVITGAFSAWLGGRKGNRPVKNWVVGCWCGYLSIARCSLAYGPADATDTHRLVSCFSKIQTGFTRVVPDKGPLNVCVCMVTGVTWIIIRFKINKWSK